MPKPSLQKNLRCAISSIEGAIVWVSFKQRNHTKLLLFLLLIYFFRVSHTCVSCWSFTGDWVTVSLLGSPGLFSVFLVNLNNAVIWIVSALPPISNSSSFLWKPFRAVLNAPIMFHAFISSLARSKYLSLFSLSLILTLWSAETAKSSIIIIIVTFFEFFTPALADGFSTGVSEW